MTSDFCATGPSRLLERAELEPTQKSMYTLCRKANVSWLHLQITTTILVLCLQIFVQITAVLSALDNTCHFVQSYSEQSTS